MPINQFPPNTKFRNKYCGLFLSVIISLGAFFAPAFSLNSFKQKFNLTTTQTTNEQLVAPLNPIAENDIKYNDIRGQYTDPTRIQQIKARKGGNDTLADFMHLLYSNFLNPLLKANPELPIPPEATDPQAFFVKNGIEDSYGVLTNYDGESLSNPWPGQSPSSPYPTTVAVIKLLNVILSPLDAAPTFKQLAAKTNNANWNPANGFFAQFIDYILTQQTYRALGGNYYHRGANGTSLNIGMFDFDAGASIVNEEVNSGLYWFHTFGIDTNNQAILTLSDQINNFMFLLANYVNAAASLLNNLQNIIPDPVGQWLMLNNLTVFGTFQTSNLFDLAAKADGWNLIYNDNSFATIFTGLPRFMINASYGKCPRLNQPTREWNKMQNDLVRPFLHYNGLIAGYLSGIIQHNDFVHSAQENRGHYWGYTDTNNMNNLQAEQVNLGEMSFLYAWNDEINYLATSEPVAFNTICMNDWPSNSPTEPQGQLITKDDLLLQDSDRNSVGLFAPDSIAKQLVKSFNLKAAIKITAFTNHFHSVQNTYNQYNYGFTLHLTNGNPITYKYFDLVQINAVNPFNLETLDVYTNLSLSFQQEQTSLLTAYSQNVKDAYSTVDRGYRQHLNGKALLYQLPNLKLDDPKLHQCANKAELYAFYLNNPDQQDSYYQHFQTEQLSIQKEHPNIPDPDNQSKHSTFNWWIIALIVTGLIITGLTAYLLWFYRTRTRHKTS